jgi:hypothetical protein
MISKNLLDKNSVKTVEGKTNDFKTSGNSIFPIVPPTNKFIIPELFKLEKMSKNSMNIKNKSERANTNSNCEALEFLFFKGEDFVEN